MVSAPPKPKPGKVEKEKPWRAYQADPNYLLLEPGLAGQLADDELAYVLEHLKTDDALSAWWGFRAKARRRSVEAIRRVAMGGDPDNQTHNRKLARMRMDPVVPGAESLVSDREKIIQRPEVASRAPGQLQLAFSA